MSSVLHILCDLINGNRPKFIKTVKWRSGSGRDVCEPRKVAGWEMIVWKWVKHGWLHCGTPSPQTPPDTQVEAPSLSLSRVARIHYPRTRATAAHVEADVFGR
ncbi:hypothetical protein J6590_026091 [Homalodisca vitripennis]|nr:hypothetical protein J6590_026091 [Homalodisca vitripennis]